MAKILVSYFSAGGNTEKMALEVVEGIKEAGEEALLKKVGETTPEDLLAADGIIMGSPTYYGQPAAPIKELLDRSVKYHGKLSGKVGGAFSSAANIGGGNETTILAILQMFLIHGMIIEGDASGDHYGPVAIDEPDSRTVKQCRRLGKRTALLCRKLSG